MGLKPSCLKGKAECGVWGQGAWGSKEREAGVEIVQREPRGLGCWPGLMVYALRQTSRNVMNARSASVTSSSPTFTRGQYPRASTSSLEGKS